MKFWSVCLLLCSLACLHAQNNNIDVIWKLYTNGQYEKMLPIIDQCMIKDSTNYQYAYLKGKALENMYLYKDAIRSQQLALQLSGEEITQVLSALASLYLASGQPLTATGFYKRLIVQEPNVIRWKINAAQALQTAGKYIEAIQWLKEASDIDSLNWIIFKNMGDCFFQIDSLNLATQCYYQAIELYPNNIQLYTQLSRLYLRMKQLELAISTGKKSIAIDSTSVDNWKTIGVAWYRLNQIDSSLWAFKHALILRDSSLLTHRHLGMIHYRMSDYFNAAKYLSKAYTADPSDMSTLYYLATTNGYVGKPKEGLLLLDTLDIMLDHYDTIRIQANIQRGYLYRTEGRYDDAALTFRKIVADFPHKPVYIYEVAASYDMARKKQQALDWYIRFLNKIDSNWDTKVRTEADNDKATYQNAATERVNALRTDLFFEESKKTKANTK